MMVAQTLRRNSRITITTSAMVSASVNSTSRTEARMVVVRSRMVSTFIAGGMVAVSRGSCALIWSTVSMTLAPGCLKTTSRMLRLLFFQAATVWSFAPVDRVADVAHADRRAVAVGDDDVVVLLRPRELVVGRDGEAVAGRR